MIAALLLIAALQSDRGGLQTLTRVEDRACTGDGAWCVALAGGVQDGEPVVRPVLRRADEATAIAKPENSAVESFQPWLGLIRLPDGGALAGVRVETQSMYSGGGGQATALRLYRLDAHGDAASTPVLSVPLQASLTIRACFGEEDMAQRAGACHDEYNFEGVLTVEAAGEALPVLTYATTATAYPRGASRSEDSLEKPPLKPADLVTARDPKCSFTRRFTFDAAAGEYRPDRKLPDCSDYTTP